MVSSYCHPNCFKTDAPNKLIFEIRDKWANQFPKYLEIKEKNEQKKEGKKEPESILEKRPEINFEINKDIQTYLKEDISSRFMPNPEKHWGPLSSAKLIFNPDTLKKTKKG